MFFRLLLFILLMTLVYRLIRGILGGIFSRPPRHNVVGSSPKPSPNLDKSRIQDAEFQDLDT